MNSNNISYQNSDPAFMITKMFERQKEIQNGNPNRDVDPFFLLKEAAEMSKLTTEGGLSLQQEENRANYANLVKGLAEEHSKSFDVNSIEEKLKKFKFAGKA
jgi:hypothetical protein